LQGQKGSKQKQTSLLRIVAHCSEAIKPVLSTLKPEQMRLISDLLSRRRPLIEMKTMEKNRIQIMPDSISSSIKPMLTAIKIS